MIRSSKHSLKFCNDHKLKDLSIFVDDYRLLVQQIIDYVWFKGYQSFSIQSNKLDCPSLIDSSYLKLFKSNYSERLKQCAGKQALSMISAATEKRRKQLWQLRKLQKESQNCGYLQRKINLSPLIKPNASKINVELDSRFVDFEFNDQKEFLCFIRLSSIKKGSNVKLPIPHSVVFSKWNSLGSLKKSIRISKENVNFFFEIEEIEKKTSGETIGCDQGIIDVITLSDGQTAPKYQDRFSLSDVQTILSRKKKGSRAFKRTQEFRKNLINWSINQLNFDDIKELRIEKLFQVRKGKASSRFLSHWTYTQINEKLQRVSEEKGFLFREVPNEFRSQRCSSCGWVCKANRKGKTFCCNKCGNKLDADLNAASNLSLDLYEIPFWVRLKKINRLGFYWDRDGLFSESRELIVPDAKRE